MLRSVSGLFESGDIILGDAFFPSFLFIIAMREKGVDLLMEQMGGRRKNTDFRKGISLGASLIRRITSLNIQSRPKNQIG
ncbi:MAG: hypothetical protein KUG79_03600 [Pseudomonadales bacterium]|nr:hypothetical protein [Pseudomonadales bacterium]